MDCQGVFDSVLTHLGDTSLVLVLLLGIGTVLMGFEKDLVLDNPIVTLFTASLGIPCFLMFIGSLQLVLSPVTCGGGGSWLLVFASAACLVSYLWAGYHYIKLLSIRPGT